ncbi:MAG: hypothetical protein AAF846_24090 [Chloroflexota bacterium]
MAIQVGWYIPNKVTYMKLVGDFTDATFIKAANYRTQIASESPAEKVHLILDTSDSAHKIDIKNYRKIELPPNNGWTIAVGGTDKVAQFVGTVAMQLMKQELRFAKTIDEAMQLLTRFDGSISPDSANIIINRQFKD